MPEDLANQTPSQQSGLDRLNAYRRIGQGLILFFIVLTLIRVVRPAFTHDDHLMRIDESGNIRIQDFASHLTFARTYWQGNGDYSPSGHLKMTSEWAGQPMKIALPFGYSPTMLGVLAPICPLSNAGAYFAWSVLGAAVVGWMLNRSLCFDGLYAESMLSPFVWVFAAAFVLLGPIGVACLAHGQTAVFSTAAIFCLALRVPDQSKGRTLRDDLVAGLLLWLLTAKPPLAITAGFALLAGKRFRAIGCALVLTAVSTGLIGLRFSHGWIEDYLALFRTYNLDEIDKAYAWSIHPESMANLRGLLHNVLGFADAMASKVSSGVWLLFLIAVVLARWSGRISLACGWCLVVMAYLLFCPHVSFTELTHLVVPLAILSQRRLGLPDVARWACLALILVSVLAPLTWAYRQPFIFGCEVALVVVFCWGLTSRSASVATP